MFFFVLGFNLGLTLFNCFLVWKLWQLRGGLGRVTRSLTKLEHRLHRVFYPAPEFMLVGRTRTHCLRQRYQHLYGKIQSLQPLLFTFSLLVRYWQRQSRRRRAEDTFIIRTKPLSSRLIP
jgi:hypothetical protein